MKLTRREVAKILDAVGYLPNPSRLSLRDYLEGRPIDKSNPYSLQAMYHFLVDIKEYTRGAAKLRKRLATILRKADIDPHEKRWVLKSRSQYTTTGGTPMAKKSKRNKKAEEVEEEETDEESDDEDMPDDIDDEDIDEEEEDDEDEDGDEDEEDEQDEESDDEDEEEEEPRPKRKRTTKNKKAKPKVKAKKEEKPKKKAKKTSARNESVPSEDRIPVLIEKMSKPGPSGEAGWTINELFHVLGQKKANAALFPTRRAVKRTLTAYEGDQFVRPSKSIWELNEGKKKKKSKKGKSKKDAKEKKGAEKKGEKKAKRKSKK